MTESRQFDDFVTRLTEAQQRLFAYVLAIAPNVSDARDILQETNLVLWRKQEEFEPNRDFWPWASRIACYQVLAHRKKAGRDRLFFDDELVRQIAAEAPLHVSDRQSALEHCLGELTDRKRELIELRYKGNLSVESMASQLGRTVGAIYDALCRIRLALAQCVERYDRKTAGEAL